VATNPLLVVFVNGGFKEKLIFDVIGIPSILILIAHTWGQNQRIESNPPSLCTLKKFSQCYMLLLHILNFFRSRFLWMILSSLDNLSHHFFFLACKIRYSFELNQPWPKIQKFIHFVFVRIFKFLCVSIVNCEMSKF